MKLINMPEIKVECDCGQRFKFDVSPVNGQMPYVLACPLCGTDCTDKANQILASVPGVAPVPMATPSARPGLRVSQPAHQPSAAPMAQPVAPVYAPAQFQPAYPTQPAERQPNFSLGVVGALLGGIVGMVVWFLIYKATGWRLGFLAIGVGALTGFGARWLGRYHGVNMGLVTGLCALLCIVGTHYIQTKAEMAVSDTDVTEIYDEEVNEAKALLADVPNGTDDEIRAFLTKQMAEFYKRAGQSPPPIEAEEIEEFRTDEWQPAQDVVSGKRTAADVRKELEEYDEEVAESTFGKIIFWVFALGIFSIVSTCIGVGTAYKIGAGED